MSVLPLQTVKTTVQAATSMFVSPCVTLTVVICSYLKQWNASQDVTEKILLEVLEAQSHNSDICGSKTKTLQLWRQVEEDSMEGALFVQQLRTEKQTNSNNMQQLQGTILVEKNLFDIYVLNYIFLASNIYLFHSI
jgi:hypothetical protein